MTARDVIAALRHLPRQVEDERWHREQLERARQTSRELEQAAVHVVGEYGHRLFVMPDGRFLTIAGEGWSTMPLVMPVSSWDAEDIYGWKS
jgi:hypothetical protein